MQNTESKTEFVAGARTPALGWALASLCLSLLMPSLDTSIANAALPTLASAFGASFQTVSWVVLAYLLAITTSIVSVGRLADVVGRRRTLLLGIAVFTGASLLCGFAPNLALLIAARALQGLGAAVMMVVTLALAAETAPKGRTGSAMGLLGTMSAIGTTLGPSLGGLLSSGCGWRSLFLINVPLGLLNFVLAHRSLPRAPLSEPTTPKLPGSFDKLGALLLTLSLAAYALAMTTSHGGFGALNLSLLLLAALGVGSFVLVEARAPAPLVRLSSFKDGDLSASLAMSLLVATVMMATLVVGPFYLSIALRLPAALVGLVLSLGPLMAAVSGIPAGRLVDWRGVGATTRIGLSGMATGCSALATFPARFGVAGYAGPMLVMTAGYALFQAANNTSLMSGVAPERRGVISGLLSLSRNLGLITGASLMGAVFSASAGATALSAAPPEAVALGMRTTFSCAALLVVFALAIASVRRRRGMLQTAGL